MIPEVVRKFNIPFNELDVTPGKILKFIKGRNASLEQVSYEYLENFLKESEPFAEVKGGFVYIPPENFKIDKEHFVLSGIEFLSQKVISAKLRRSDSAALFVVTAGSYFEYFSKKLMTDGDVFSGYLVDAAASEIAEAAAEWIEKRIDEFSCSLNLKTTSRYSPGYCGWWVGEQQKLFSFLPERFCGITLTDSSLMLPVKSISGIIGIGENVRKEEYECAICEEENCFRRNI